MHGAYRVANQQSLACLSGSERRRPGWFLESSVSTGWAPFRVNFRPLQEIKVKYGGGRIFDTGPFIARLRYWLKNHRPKHPFKHRVKPFCGWMTKPALPVVRHGIRIDPGIQKAWILLHLFVHSSDTFILIGTYLSLFKCLVRLTTQRIDRFFYPMPGYRVQVLDTRKDCISNSAILSNNFVSLLSDL